MANLSDQKTLQNKSVVMGPTTIHLDTVSDLDPASYEGTFAYSSDKKMYFSNGSVWRTTEDPVIKTPNASAPTSDTTTERQLTLSSFLNSSVLTNYKQTGVIFEISLSPSMKNPIMQKTITTAITTTNPNGTTKIDYPLVNKYNLLTTDTIPNLKPGDVFYWRGKYLATDGQESGFSKPYEQKFPNFIDTPKPVTAPNQTTNVVEVSKYHSPFGIENLYPPYLIEWELWSLSEVDPTVRVGFTRFSSDIALNNPLNTIKLFPKPDTVYYWRARYISTPASGRVVSEYSTTFSSKQVRDIPTPKIVPVLGATGKTVRLKITPYSSLTNQERSITEWLIATSADKLDNNPELVINKNSTEVSDTLEILTLPNSILADGTTTYYWKAKYKNVQGIESEYSPGSTFIRYPEIITPTVITIPNSETKTLVVSDFNSEYSTLYPYTLTEWRVYDVNNGNNLVYSEDSTSNNTLNIFAQTAKILPDGTYNWTVRYKNSRGTYTALVSSINSQIPWIYTPTPITVANGATNQDSLVASAFSSEYGVTPESSEITITALNGTLLEVIPNNTSPDKVNIYSGLRGYSSKLQQGNTYNWKVKYTGFLNGIRVSKYSNTSTYTQPLFILTPSINAPVSTDPSGRFEGPTITLEASKFATFANTANSISDQHISSDWQLSTTKLFDGWDDGTNRTITARVDKSETFKDTWVISNLKPATTYYARVRYYGNRGYSDWSQVIEFSTLFEYKHFLTLPANYNPNPTIGAGYAGGFFAGSMWQNITSTLSGEANNRYKIANIVVGQTLSFEVPSMQFNRIVYSGQIIQIRSTAYPRYVQITGKVTTASATTLKILVTNIFIDSSMGPNTTISAWSVMAKFHIIVSPKSSAGNITKTYLRSSIIQETEVSWDNFILADVDRTVLPNDKYLLDVTSEAQYGNVLTYPEEFFNLSDGQGIQTEMWRFSWLWYAWYCTTNNNPNSRANRAPQEMFPLAHAVYNLNKSGGINTYSDWYVPSRDELQTCFRNLTPTDYGTGISTTFANYFYNFNTYTNTSLSGTYYRTNSYIGINGNISDNFPTLLNTVSTPVLAPEPNHGSNNNSEPAETSYFYTISDKLNANNVTPYLKQTTSFANRYYFPQSKNLLFAFNGTESLVATVTTTNYLGITTASTVDTLYTSTCVKSNTSAYEFNNTSVIGGATYKNPPYTLFVDKNITSFGRMVPTYSYNETSVAARLIRRQLA